jgi:hypothetical protein
VLPVWQHYRLYPLGRAPHSPYIYNARGCCLILFTFSLFQGGPMKRITFIALFVIAAIASSCSVFIFNDDDRHAKKSSDTTTITIISSDKTTPRQ